MFVISIEGESNMEKVKNLMKIKLCVDAQLLHPKHLSECLEVYAFLAR